jgi:cellulose synthase/poly-beta-1,6-N-acetylglucosamine synthase-like glycosyltransferase
VDGAVDADAGQEHRKPTQPYVLDVVIPVYNEQDDLPTCVRRLHQFLASDMPYRSQITIADNASTDETLLIAQQLAAEIADVRVIHLDAKGRRTRQWSPTWTSTCPPTCRR